LQVGIEKKKKGGGKRERRKNTQKKGQIFGGRERVISKTRA